MAQYNFSYTPREQFFDFHQRMARFSSLVCHRRAGKTFACVNELVLRAIYTPKQNARYAYIAPFYKQAKDIAWVYLKDAVEGFAVAVRESELRVILPNGAWITLYGADNPDALRGIYLDGVILDEYGDCRPSLYTEVILPTLADRSGWAVFIGTPKGKNHFFKIHARAIKEDKWFDMTLKASVSKILKQEDLDEMRGQMTAAQYAQEFECDFTAAVMGTYYADFIQAMELDSRIGPNPQLYDPFKPVEVACDLGYSDSTAFWFWQDGEMGPNIIKYYENQGQPLSHYIDLLKNSPYKIERLWVPHDAKAKTLQTGRSTIQQLMSAGLPCVPVPWLNVQHGIDAARLILPKCTFDTLECGEGIEALRAYKREYNEVTKAFQDKPKHDWASDGADAFRYLSLVAGQKTSTITKEIKPVVFEPHKYTLDELFNDREKGEVLNIARRRI